MKNKVLVCLIFLLMACAPVDTEKKEREAAVEKGITFVKQQLTDPMGLIESYPYQVKQIPYQPDYHREALSETAGLWLEVLLERNLREDFKNQFNILKKYFLLPNGTLSWRLEIHGMRAVADPHSATIDDLRIIRVLLEASRKWDETGYETFALQLAESMKKHAVNKGYLLHQTILEGEENEPPIVDLSYLDLGAMAGLVERDPSWREVYESSLALLMTGNRSSGLFYDRYNLASQQYFDEDKNMINQVISSIDLAERGFPQDTLLNFLKTEWEKNGKIYAQYDLDTKKPAVDYENEAFYGLTIQFSCLQRDSLFADNLLKYALKRASRQKREEWQGSLCEDACHSFDHLEMMLALTRGIKGCRKIRA